MKIIIDESVDFYFVRLIISYLFPVISIAESFSSMTDEDIVLMSQSPPALIITEDKDFGDLVFYRQLKVFAVILLRYNKTERSSIGEKLTDFLIKDSEKLQNSFTIITFNKIRIRKLTF